MGDQKPVNVRCGVDVVAGILPGTPEDELTRQFFLTSEEWHRPEADHVALLCDLAGRANAYATYLMLQPDRLNWVKLEWVWF